MHADELDRARRVEVIEQHGPTAGVQADAERDVQPEDMEERQRREPDVVGADAQPGMILHLTDVRGEVAVREHRARGAPRCPT